MNADGTEVTFFEKGVRKVFTKLSVLGTSLLLFAGNACEKKIFLAKNTVSRYVPIPAAGVAQLAEQLICNQQVAGSIPIASSIFRSDEEEELHISRGV